MPDSNLSSTSLPSSSSKAKCPWCSEYDDLPHHGWCPELAPEFFGLPPHPASPNPRPRVVVAEKTVGRGTLEAPTRLGSAYFYDGLQNASAPLPGESAHNAAVRQHPEEF
jgi:hypothetical protein